MWPGEWSAKKIPPSPEVTPKHVIYGTGIQFGCWVRDSEFRDQVGLEIELDLVSDGSGLYELRQAIPEVTCAKIGLTTPTLDLSTPSPSGTRLN